MEIFLSQLFVVKKFVSEIFWLQKIWVGFFTGQKNLGQNFFGVGNLVWPNSILIFDLLLITAPLNNNNNNTELFGGWWVGQYP